MASFTFTNLSEVRLCHSSTISLLNSVPSQGPTTLFLLSLVTGHLVCVQFLAIMDNSPINLNA